MSVANENSFSLSLPFRNIKVKAVESTLQQTISNFKDLVLEFEQLHIENKNLKNLLLSEKEKPQSQTCSNCEGLEKIIALKEQKFDFVASVLNKLIQTKDLNLLNLIFKEINREINILTPPLSVSPVKDIKHNTDQNLIPPKQINNEMGLKKCDFINVKNEFTNTITDKKEMNDESVSEIESTPTGRKSPIIHSKTAKSGAHCLSLNDKKKCPETWPTPEKKTIKLLFPTPSRNRSSGRLRQGRLHLIKVKTSNVVDLTCSPEYSEKWSPVNNINQNNVKKETMDNDETILPSPTSNLVKLPLGYKSMSKDSPVKIKIPVVMTKPEIDTDNYSKENKPIVKIENIQKTGESFNIPNQVSNRIQSPVKEIKYEYITQCGDESISLLQCLKKCDNKQLNSPSKRPLTENKNIINLMNQENEASMSILQRDVPVGIPGTETVKRNKANMEVVYKEAAVRKKTEKRALPGWSCDECKQFYAELYKDDLDMLAQKMDECSKHRGRHNPIRPKTPDGFWNPRWEVPENTEEFNRRNNV